MFLMRSVDGRIWDFSFGRYWSVDETPIFKNVCSNLCGINTGRQYLVDSFSGALSSKTVTEEPKGQLAVNGNHGDSVWAQAGLTARRTCRADAKAEPSEPTLGIRCWGRLSDKSYSRDNRLVPPKSSYRRRSSAPRCRLTLSWWWRSCQGFSCSLIKKVRELGSNR